MNAKVIRPREKLPERVGKLLKRATVSTGEFVLPKELLGLAFSNVDKVRRETLNILFKELGKQLEEIADNYTVRVKAEFSFERKKNKKKPKA